MTTTFEKIIKNIQLLGTWKESNLDYYFTEVKDDINTLKKFNEDYKYWNETTMEIHKEDYEIRQRNRIKEKYSKTYCPCMAFPREFSRSQKMRYLTLRIEIDKLLNITDTKYII